MDIYYYVAFRNPNLMLVHEFVYNFVCSVFLFFPQASIIMEKVVVYCDII